MKKNNEIEIDDALDPLYEVDQEDDDLAEVLSEDEQALLSEDTSNFSSTQVRPERAGPSDWHAKKILAIVGIIVGLLAVFLIVFSLFTNRAEREATIQDYRDEVTIDFDTLVSDSKSIREAVDGLSTLENFPTLESLLAREVVTLEAMIGRLAKLKAPEQYREWQGDFAAFLVRYRDYYAKLIPVLNATDFAKIDDRALSDLVTLGAELRGQAALLRSDADFIKSDIDSVVFTALPANVRRLVVAELETLVGEQIQANVEKEQAEKAKEQLAQEEAAAVETVDGFLTAYIDGDTAQATTYLALNVRDEYDLTPDPSDQITAFAILSKTPQQGGGYSVIVRLTHLRTIESEPPSSAPIGDLPTQTTTSNEEIRLSRQNETFLLNYIEFLEP